MSNYQYILFYDVTLPVIMVMVASFFYRWNMKKLFSHDYYKMNKKSFFHFFNKNIIVFPFVIMMTQVFFDKSILFSGQDIFGNWIGNMLVMLVYGFTLHPIIMWCIRKQSDKKYDFTDEVVMNVELLKYNRYTLVADFIPLSIIIAYHINGVVYVLDKVYK